MQAGAVLQGIGIYFSGGDGYISSGDSQVTYDDGYITADYVPVSSTHSEHATFYCVLCRLEGVGGAFLVLACYRVVQPQRALP